MRKILLLSVLTAGSLSILAAETVRLNDFVWENDNPNKYHVPSIPISGLTPGMRAEVTMWVDARGLSKDGVPEASLAWGSRKTGSSWAQGSGTVWGWKSPKIEKDKAGRRKFVCRTGVMPSDGTAPQLHFFAKRPATGKIVYSDLELKLYPRTYDMRIADDAYAHAADAGAVRFVATYTTDPACESADRLVGTFAYRNRDGKTVRRAAGRMDANAAEVTLDAADFALGRQMVTFELGLRGGAAADPAVLCKVEGAFERLAKPANYRVMFDKAGRLRVEGKPFFPIGMYWSENTLSLSNSLARYAAPGVFNCLQTYEKAMTPEILDRYWAHGLRVMASVKDIYLPNPDGSAVAFLPKGITTKAEETAYVTKVVNRCKDHPALLAWYTCDEMASRYADRLEDRYDLLKRLDPDHPVYVLAFADATRAFLRAYDVTGTDPYPVCCPFAGKGDETPGMGVVWRAGNDAERIVKEMFGFKPLWQVPQAFKWQWDKKDCFELRFPTRRELSSMTWQQVAAGANGIYFYSYGQMCNATKNGRESELIEYFDETTVPVARELKDRVEILLAEPGPAATSVPKRVRVRTWTKKGGWLSGDETYALVCNCYPERRTGTVEIEGDWTSCETVFGSGVTLAGGKLALDMGPIVSTMVRLK